MSWPWKRVEQMMISHIRRRARDDLERRHLARVTGLFANSNYDSDQKDLRTPVLMEMEESLERSITALYADFRDKSLRDLAKEHKLFAAMSVPE